MSAGNGDIEALQDRLSRLSRASLRISESVDLEAVSQEVLDCASELSDSRYGVIMLFDGEGNLEEFLTTGMSTRQRRRFRALPDGERLYEYLRTIQAPMRVRDFHSHAREMGLPEFRPPLPVSSVLSFMTVPIRHGHEVVGNIYLGEKNGGSYYTRRDEETLVAFANHSALVIANARRYRVLQRERDNLQTVVDTSPVGVVVFDAESGALEAFNREA